MTSGVHFGDDMWGPFIVANGVKVVIHHIVSITIPNIELGWTHPLQPNTILDDPI